MCALCSSLLRGMINRIHKHGALAPSTLAARYRNVHGKLTCGQWSFTFWQTPYCSEMVELPTNIIELRIHCFHSVTLRKTNLTFVTSVTWKIKITTPKQMDFLGGLWGGYIPGFNLIHVILSYLSCGNGCPTEFDLCDLCDLENQAREPKMNILWWAYRIKSLRTVSLQLQDRI